MTKHTGRRYRKMNEDIDRQLKHAGLRPMAEAWPPDPVKIGPLGVRAERWVDLALVLTVIGTGLIVWWLFG